MSKFTYYTNCVDASSILGREAGDYINEMKRGATRITRPTFVKYVDKKSRQELEESLGYALHPAKGLVMSRDQLVGYFKSEFYNGTDQVPCYYFAWSGIEYIFTQQ